VPSEMATEHTARDHLVGCAPTQAQSITFDARDTLAGNHDDTTVRQAVGGQ